VLARHFRIASTRDDASSAASKSPVSGGIGRRQALRAAAVNEAGHACAYAPAVLTGGGHSEAPGAVGVVIPSRDRWPFLRTAVASALAQAEVDVRVVVVDDGSTDATPAELRAVRDPRMRVIRLERTEGVSRARNAGLAHVDAPWVAFLDDDDVWAPRHLSAMLAAAAGSCPR
jgi:hypothetical protein